LTRCQPGEQIDLERVHPRYLEDQVEVIGQDDEGENAPLEALDRPAQEGQEALAVEVIADDVLARIAACHHMVNRAGISNW
jgi:hypothetical protein